VERRRGRRKNNSWWCNPADETIGGSFGVVYKAIERASGDIVAIKHVSSHHHNMRKPPYLTDSRSTSNPARMTFKKFNRRFPS
jgi:hypothetical protein